MIFKILAGIIVLSLIVSSFDKVGDTMETEKGLFIYGPQEKWIEVNNISEIKEYKKLWEAKR